jgi:hypothetical protein
MCSSTIHPTVHQYSDLAFQVPPLCSGSDGYRHIQIIFMAFFVDYSCLLNQPMTIFRYHATGSLLALTG